MQYFINPPARTVKELINNYTLKRIYSIYKVFLGKDAVIRYGSHPSVTTKNHEKPNEADL